MYDPLRTDSYAQHLYAIYTNKLVPKGRSLRDILPIVQVNSYIYHPQTCNIVLQIFRELKPPENSSIDNDNIREFTAIFMRDSLYLQNYLERVEQIVEQLPKKEHRLLRAVRTVDGHLNKLASGSGILSDGYRRWSGQVAAEHLSHAYREMEDAYLMSQEVGWQLIKMTRLLRSIADEEDVLDGIERDSLNLALENLPSLTEWTGKQ